MLATGYSSVTRAAAVAVLLALPSGAFLSQPVAAQDLFEALFGAFDPAPRRAQPRDDRWQARAYAPRDDERYLGRRETETYTPRAERPAVASAPRGASVNCVRLCDGRYFPAPRSVNGAPLDPAKVCNALCPMAKTQVFNGGNIEYASAADGTRYSDLDNAFAFRDKNVPDCSCTGNGPGGLAQIAIESDPTLRVGDVVVTAEGPTVFRGSKQFPYKTVDFTPVEDYGRLNKELRQKLSELQVNQTALPAVAPQTIEAAVEVSARSSERKSRPRRERSQANNAAGARADFPFRPWW